MTRGFTRAALALGALGSVALTVAFTVALGGPLGGMAPAAAAPIAQPVNAGGLSTRLAAPPASEPHPETQLLSALDALQAGKVEEAWSALDRLVKRQPNFRLARLFHSELLAARTGAAPAERVASDADLAGLAEEARLRLDQWHERIPENAVPDVILQLSKGHPHAVVVDLPRSRLYLLENTKDGMRVLKSFFASIGKGGWGKRSTGDNRTPVGVYHVTGFIKDQVLPELYGAGAFPVSYPNVWDQRLKYTGSGIWLHGVPRDIFNRAPRSSEGCVTLANGDLLELKPYLVAGETPVVFTDALAWQPRERGWDRRAEFLEHVEGWRARWSALDTEGYLAYYADDFETDGMNKQAFAQHKRRVNANKKAIRVELEGVDLFRYPGPDGLMLARFTQRYRSNNFVKDSDKYQFWRRQPDGQWRIVKESSH
jgi:murein L,D-transpeptidase YafK